MLCCMHVSEKCSDVQKENDQQKAMPKVPYEYKEKREKERKAYFFSGETLCQSVHVWIAREAERS